MVRESSIHKELRKQYQGLMTSNEFNSVASNIKSDVGMRVKLLGTIEKTMPEEELVGVKVMVSTIDQESSRRSREEMSNSHVVVFSGG